MIKKNFIFILSVSLKLSAHAYNFSPSAFTPLKSEQSQFFSLWTKDFKGDAQEVSKKLETIFQKIHASSLFKKKLPSKVAVLLDGEWNKTAGYWSPDLISSKEEPALLLGAKSFVDEIDLDGVIMHELTHLVHYGFRPFEESWAREGLALLVEYLHTGRKHPMLEETYRNPEASLVGMLYPTSPDYEFNKDKLSQYGLLQEYFYYLYENCGEAAFLNNLLASASKEKGLIFLDKLLKALSAKYKLKEFCQNFEASFKAYNLARFKADPLSPEGLIWATTLKITIRAEPPELPPYSGAAYRRQKHSDPCLAESDIAWGNQCIRIRYH